ncbi:NAD+ synthetase [Opitutaceae bacterium TAV5]|nr:NAD+ synthetase [Opitutaceae bacterium TAV5]
MKNTSILRVWTGAALLLATGVAAQAHQLWIGANRYQLSGPGEKPGPQTVYVHASWGHRLPVDEPPDPLRFAGYLLFAPGSAPAPVASGEGGYRVARLDLEKPGLYWIAATYRPAFSTRVKTADGRQVYLPGPKDEAPADVAVQEGTLISDHAKTLLQVAGEGAREETLTQPVGHTIELVPLKNPALLAPGESLPLQVRFKGAAYQGDPVEVTTENSVATALGEPPRSIETDAQGRVDIPLAQAGVWLLVAAIVELAPPELAAKADRVRYRCSLTFAVPAPGKP